MNKFLKYLVASLPFLAVFIFSLYQPLDSDLGWHLKYGEYFFQNGQILRGNTFSTEMPNYKWANTSWLTDLLTYGIYAPFGFLGLSLVSALIVSATFYFFSKASKLDFFEQSLIIPVLLLFVYPVNFVSFRGQQISLMFTGIMYYLLSLYQIDKSKKIYLLVPLFILWVNTHGQFLLGLGLLYIWILTYLFKYLFKLKDNLPLLKQEVKVLVPVALLSTLGTLFNPWGLGIHEQTLAHFNNPQLKNILEYLPFKELTTFWWNQVLLGFLVFFGLIAFFFKDKIKEKLPWIAPLVLFYIMAFWVRRYSWTMYYLAMPLMQPVASFFRPSSPKNAARTGMVVLLLFIGLTIWMANPFARLSNMNWQTFCQLGTHCSDQAMQHLIENKYPGEMMTMYNWGGYIIWNYPQLKPSIDGRMHLWEDPQTGYNAFSEFFAYEQNLEDIDKSKYDVVLMSREKPIIQRLAQLTNEGKWKMVHLDKTAAVFVRNTLQP